MATAEMAAAGLHAEGELDGGCRCRGDADADRSDQRLPHRDQGERDDEGGKDQGDAAGDGLYLGAQHLAVCHRRSGDQVGRIFARDGEPRQAAGELSGRHDQDRHQQAQPLVAQGEAAPQQNGRGQQIEQLHQRLRHEPGIAAQ
jgi:hypothetical protein